MHQGTSTRSLATAFFSVNDKRPRLGHRGRIIPAGRLASGKVGVEAQPSKTDAIGPQDAVALADISQSAKSASKSRGRTIRISWKVRNPSRSSSPVTRNSARAASAHARIAPSARSRHTRGIAAGSGVTSPPASRRSPNVSRISSGDAASFLRRTRRNSSTMTGHRTSWKSPLLARRNSAAQRPSVANAATRTFVSNTALTRSPGKRLPPSPCRHASPGGSAVPAPRRTAPPRDTG